MSEWTKFTDEQINAIKCKLNKQFDKGMKILFLLSPIICSIIPYIPGRKGRGRMIDRMEYNNAVLQTAIIWLLSLIGIWIWHNYKINNQFSQNRKFLRKKNITTMIKRKSKSAFAFYDNLLITELDGELKSIEIDKKQSDEFKVGHKIQIEYEEQTDTILKLKKVIGG